MWVFFFKILTIKTVLFRTVKTVTFVYSLICFRYVGGYKIRIIFFHNFDDFWLVHVSVRVYWIDYRSCLFVYKTFFFAEDNSTINTNWTDSMGLCKENGTYLAGNINLSNVNSACLGYVHKTPRWIGVFRENYFKTDHGN